VSSTGLARARFLERLGALSEAVEPDVAIALYEEALAAARNDKTQSERIRKALVYLRSRDFDSEGNEEVTSTGRKALTPAELGELGLPEAEQLALANLAETGAAGPAATRGGNASAQPGESALRDELAGAFQEPDLEAAFGLEPRADDELPELEEEPAARIVDISEMAARSDEIAAEDEETDAVEAPPFDARGAGEAEAEGEELASEDDVEAIDSDAAGAAAVSAAPVERAREPSAPAAPLPATARALPPPLPAPAARLAASLALGADEGAPESAAPASRVPASRALAALWPAIESSAEEGLFLRLLSGFPEAGDELIASYRGARTRDVLVVRRHQAAMRPGHRATLEALHTAALADSSAVYARAVEHVITLGASAAPPPLSLQTPSAEFVHRLLFRDLTNASTEALSLVWESGLLRKDSTTAGLSKATRVVPGPGNPVSEALAMVVGLFGARPLYQTTKDGEPRVSVTLLSTPALVYEGDVRGATSAELLYLLASHAAAAAPEFAIVAAEPEVAVRHVIEAVVSAFGPVSAAPRDTPPGATRATIARIGSELWQRVLPAAERKLRALASEQKLSFEDARAATDTAMRRAGLFASGDLGLAVRIALADAGVTAPGRSEELEQLCAEHPAIADLVRLAIRMEYAEARFYAAPTSALGARRPGSLTRGG
jgi:hypothetical protein